ncbi:protein SHQ1 homolog [Diachasma alloeum]|uniref:protein SHQ1 homolog n=1 Tax=Diachasma alloeum TaxID=454923 RepID=UPI0007382693|nr:protein SHQ1 homolog [Diachasma alloeum]
MLTPRFELKQDDDEVTISIYARYANIRDTEVYVEGNDFRFHSSPYYLRLKLPGKIIENDDSKGSYDCDTGTFTLKFSKLNKGEHFENLDMITTLLAPPKKNKDVAPTIEVIGNPAAQHEDGVDPLSEGPDQGDDDDGDDWFIPQVSVAPGVSNILSGQPKYGFANKVSGALTSFDSGWLRDVIDLPHPDSTPAAQRKSLREADEKAHFSDDHYMADLVQVEETAKPSIIFSPQWYQSSPESILLTDNEKDILKELPNKEYLLDNEEKQAVLYGLVDILFASCYNHRVTQGENSSESSWDINKISSTLSWFQTYSSLEDVIRTSIRRSLCYPLYRHWDLSMKVLEDVKQILKLGKKMVLKRFCEIHELFNNSFEPRYLLNQLYIRDYLIWIQQAPDSLILSLFNALDGLLPKKEDMGFDLVELETAAWSVLEEENQQERIDEGSEEQNLIIGNSIHDVVNQLNKMEMGSEGSDESDSETDSDIDTSSSSSLSSSSCSSSSESSTESSDESSGERKRGPLILEMGKELDSDDSTDEDH